MVLVLLFNTALWENPTHLRQFSFASHVCGVEAPQITNLIAAGDSANGKSVGSSPQHIGFIAFDGDLCRLHLEYAEIAIARSQITDMEWVKLKGDSMGIFGIRSLRISWLAGESEREIYVLGRGETVWGIRAHAKLLYARCQEWQAS